MDKVKIGIIGAGNIANEHIKSYQSVEDAEVYAICDINEERLLKTADKFGIERRYKSVDEMLADCSKLDAADVCVWNVNHAECTIKALEAGLNVLCEKPMAYNAEEAQKMKEAAHKAGKLLMIGFVMRFSDNARIAKDFIDKGYLGDIYYSKAQYIRRHGNPGGWFSNKELSGGGPVIDLGVHAIDLIRYLMGNPKPVSVYGASFDKLGRRDYLKTRVGWRPEDANESDPCTVEDFATALIRYDNGAVTQLETSYSINGENGAQRQIFGTKAGMDLTNGVKLYTECNGFLADTEIKTEFYKGGGNMFVSELRHFTDCIKNGTPCCAKAEDGVEMMRILDAIYLSAKTGHEVVL